MPVVDGVREPRDAEFEFALRGFDVERVGGIPGVDGVACECVSKKALLGVASGFGRIGIGIGIGETNRSK